MPFMQKLAKILRFYDLNTPFRLILNQCSYLANFVIFIARAIVIAITNSNMRPKFLKVFM